MISYVARYTQTNSMQHQSFVVYLCHAIVDYNRFVAAIQIQKYNRTVCVSLAQCQIHRHTQLIFLFGGNKKAYFYSFDREKNRNEEKPAWGMYKHKYDMSKLCILILHLLFLSCSFTLIFIHICIYILMYLCVRAIVRECTVYVKMLYVFELLA